MIPMLIWKGYALLPLVFFRMVCGKEEELKKEYDPPAGSDFNASSSGGATCLGWHLEGPFINTRKKGAHPEALITDFEGGMRDVEARYGSLDSGVIMVTLAPELRWAPNVVRGLVDRGIVVSVGHSAGKLSDGEAAFEAGARCVTHLFNAMSTFHHRDPGLLGLLWHGAAGRLPVYYGLIVDGFHTHAASLHLAHSMHPAGLCLVTDAMAAMGLAPGEHRLGKMTVTLDDHCRATLSGTDILAGSAASMDTCVRNFAAQAGLIAALEAASLHPAEALGIASKKGHLGFGADADLVLLDDDLSVHRTFIAGECVWTRT
eukprot:UC1_evm4s131